MSLPQFLALLDNRALFFPSVATLSAGDPYEGEPTIAKFRHAEMQGQNALRKLRLQTDIFKHLNFFNCWHMNDGESDAMWKIYSHSSEGVAIQSTVGRLMESLQETLDTVYMGQITYRHPIIPDQPESRLSSFSDYMFKRPAFRHENEVRLGTYREDVRTEFFDEWGSIKYQEGIHADDVLLCPNRKGIDVNVDIPTLVERVVVSPLAAPWFSNLVISLCRKLSYTFDIGQSDMSYAPRL